MPAPRIYDYRPVKEEFVQSDTTLSDLARKYGIRSISTLTRRAKAEGWERLRAEFRRQLENKSLEAVAEKRAQKIADIHMDSLNVIHLGILKLGEDMQAVEPVMEDGRVLRDKGGDIVYRPAVRYTPRDLATLVEKFLVLTGQPSDVKEERHLGIGISAETDQERLAELLAALRSRAAHTD